MLGIYENIDCMELMSRYHDKHFDLAIVDPPYGIGEDGKGSQRHRGGQIFTFFEKRNWDNEKPNKEYFTELFRVSKNQIIWGANYFVEFLNIGTMGWIFWDKLIGGDFSDGELAYTSFNRALKKFTCSPEKNYSTNALSAEKYKRIHPCQKPLKLYKWLLNNYAKKGYKILDTHVGSGSSLIACEDLGFEYVACELDAYYYEQSMERIKKYLLQPKLIEIPIKHAEHGELF